MFEDGGIKHIIAGFEDGKISYWDIRMPEREVSSLEVFSEPGRNHCAWSNGVH